MALGYLPVDRDQQFLLPPSMRDWLPEDHLVWFVLEVVDRLDTSRLHARHPNDGVGRRAYDPDMLLALMIYAYCTGVRSSRQIERLCLVDVAFRVLVGGHRPDHTTIARFRQHHEAVAAELFVDVLALCAEVGLVKLGVVAIDGTKIGADASLKANRSRAQLEREVASMMAEAGHLDASEDAMFGDARGDEPPEELRDRQSRGVRLDAAVKELDERRKARDAERDAAKAAQREAWDRRRGSDGRRPGGQPPAELELELAEEAVAVEERRAAERRALRAEREARAAGKGHKMSGPVPSSEPRGLRLARQRLERARARAAETPAAEPDPERVNVTDPDSRIMKDPRGWVQGYNAQAAVTEDGVVVAADVTQDSNDVNQCTPMMQATGANLTAAAIDEQPGVLLFDAGYLSEDNLAADGPDRLIATGKAWKLRRSDPTEGPPPDDATPIEAMGHRLRTPEGSALYAKRQHTVEPVFGDIKHLRGLRRFSRRGLTAVDAEWKLQLMAHNILKMFRHQPPTLA
jgi:transposase